MTDAAITAIDGGRPPAVRGADAGRRRAAGAARAAAAGAARVRAGAQRYAHMRMYICGVGRRVFGDFQPPDVLCRIAFLPIQRFIPFSRK